MDVLEREPIVAQAPDPAPAPCPGGHAWWTSECLPRTFEEPSWDDRMDGLEVLVHALRFPETIFGPPCDRPAVVDSTPLDWDLVPEQIADALEESGGRCCHLYFHLKLGAEVLARHGVRICRGEPLLSLIHDEGDTDAFIQLCVDADSELTHRLTFELNDRAIDVDLPNDGFCFCFTPGQRSASEADRGDTSINYA